MKDRPIGMTEEDVDLVAHREGVDLGGGLEDERRSGRKIVPDQSSDARGKRACPRDIIREKRRGRFVNDPVGHMP